MGETEVHGMLCWDMRVWDRVFQAGLESCLLIEVDFMRGAEKVSERMHTVIFQ